MNYFPHLLSICCRYLLQVLSAVSTILFSCWSAIVINKLQFTLNTACAVKCCFSHFVYLFHQSTLRCFNLTCCNYLQSSLVHKQIHVLVCRIYSIHFFWIGIEPHHARIARHTEYHYTTFILIYMVLADVQRENETFYVVPWVSNRIYLHTEFRHGLSIIGVNRIRHLESKWN